MSKEFVCGLSSALLALGLAWLQIGPVACAALLLVLALLALSIVLWRAYG